MTEPPDPAAASETGAAMKGRSTAHRVERFGAIGRGPVRIESMRVALTMMEELL